MTPSATKNAINQKAATLVPRLDESERRSPRWFRVRVALLILTNYSVILGLVLLLVAVALFSAYHFWANGPTAVVSLGWAAIVGAWLLIDTLWVPIPEPPGFVLLREDAPKLYALMEDLRREADAPPVRAIRLKNVCNAAIFSRYRYGLVGPTTTELVIGFPLLLFMSSQDLRLILRHEFAHTRSGQGHFTIWAFRVFQSWSQVPFQDRQLHPVTRLILSCFAHWFLPRLQAYEAVLSRAQELVADSYAAGEAEAHAKASILVRLCLADWFLTLHFWPGIWADAATSPEPPDNAFESLRVEAAKFPRAIQDALLEIPFNEERDDDLLSSHPTLRERLAALDVHASLDHWQRVLPDAALSPVRSAAEAYLESHFEEWNRKFSEQWKLDTALDWKRRFNHFENYRKRRKELDAKEKTGPLTPDELWERAEGAFAVSGAEAAEPFLHALLQAEPTHAKANYQLGSVLLSRNDESGVALVEKAVGLDSSLGETGRFIVAGFLERRGREDEAREYLKTKSEELGKAANVVRERWEVKPDDTFLPHGIEPDRVQVIAEGLSSIVEAAYAYLVRKELSLSPNESLHVLAVGLRRTASRPSLNQGLSLQARLAGLEGLPEKHRLIVLDDSKGPLARALQKVPAAEIFRR